MTMTAAQISAFECIADRGATKSSAVDARVKSRLLREGLIAEFNYANGPHLEITDKGRATYTALAARYGKGQG